MAGSQSSPPSPLPAFPSHPSDIELIQMLRIRVCPGRPTKPAGNNSPIIHNANVFAQDPADLTRRFAPAVAEDGKKAWYFFSPQLPKSKQGGKRKSRCMESGVWHDQGKTHTVVAIRGSKSEEIGYRNHFSFKKKVDGKKKATTGWIMKEFRVDEESLVLCKIYTNRSRFAPHPAMSNEAAPAQAHAELEVVVARAAAVAVREAAVAAREAAVEVREAAVAADVEAVVVLASCGKVMEMRPDVEEEMPPVVVAGVQAVADVEEEMPPVIAVGVQAVADVEEEMPVVVAADVQVVADVEKETAVAWSHQDLNQTRGSEHAYINAMDAGSPCPQYSDETRNYFVMSNTTNPDERPLAEPDLDLAMNFTIGSESESRTVVSDDSWDAMLYNFKLTFK